MYPPSSLRYDIKLFKFKVYMLTLYTFMLQKNYYHYYHRTYNLLHK